MMRIYKEKRQVEKIIRGDAREFKRFFKKYKNLVFHVIYGIVPDENDQEELSQEIFIKIYKNLPSFEFKSKLSTWIAKIAYNSALNFIRDRKKKLIHGSDDFKDTGANDANGANPGFNIVKVQHPPPDENLLKEEMHNFLQEKIEQLPVQYKKILTFFHLDNMSYQEISDITDLPLGSVKSYIYRARKSLKDSLLGKFGKEAKWR